MRIAGRPVRLSVWALAPALAAGLIGAALLSTGGAMAQDGGVPLPPERPDGLGEAGKPLPPLPPGKPARDGGSAASPSGAAVPDTASRPSELKPTPSSPGRTSAATPRLDPNLPGGAKLGSPEEEAPEGAARANTALTEEQACEERLRDLGVAFTPQPPLQEGACVVPAPLAVSSLSAAIRMSAPMTLNCPATEALARWAAGVVAPAVRRELQAELTGVSATGYACRTRNHDPAEKMSEHARANATDVFDLVIAGQPRLTIGSVPAEDQARQAVETAARRGACRYFETVLGPGADPEHANHLHLDRRQRPNGFRICE